ncbi:MFS transporter [Salinibacterium sp. NSLL150]|uniref:MFS transporter n=1 Tax=unclassified Salinibacterium TaxID=2632331 RepID=UPI0018CECAF1|nr:MULTISPECIES: MFS transporter [unclassified Salinibacterium]MBH0098090.1 MFS transporter [Salinibacterium sp. NSLL35]MBH0100845.1 MFS transporter [Salinibacterium sp. NSLL150]MBH0103604.1 MFS transporter [Salinibacterium sp. NSLL16]MBH0106365.1 MFS transporter [Salinibacterium sp. NSLL17]
MTAGNSAAAQQRAPHRWATFAVLAATAALTILDVSKVGVALPAIQASTGGSGSTIQVMVVGYTLAYAVLLLPAGRVGDVLSRKGIFLVGGFMFLGASVVCALAPDIAWLIGGRLLQGAGAGILMPQVLGLIQRIFPPEERSRPLAALAATIAATALFGPVIAGVLMELVGGPEAWRALFWLNVVIGIVVLPVAVFVVREPRGEKRHGFDSIGVILLTPAVILLAGPLSTVSSDSPASWLTLALTLLGAIFALAFVFYERQRARNGRQALVDPLLFGFRHLTVGVFIAGFMHAAATAGTLVITVGLQREAGQTALQTALWMLPAAVATIIGSWIAGRLPQRSTYRLIAIGTGMGALSLAGIAVAFGSAPLAALPWIVSAILVTNSFGNALAGPANQARTLVEVPDYRASVAGSLIQFSQRFGSAIGIAFALILYYGYEDVATVAGQPTLGPTLAIALTSVFLFIAAILALLDRARSRRTAPLAEPELRESNPLAAHASI